MSHHTVTRAPSILGHVASLNPAGVAKVIATKAQHFEQWAWIDAEGCVMCARQEPAANQQLVGLYIAPRTRDVMDDLEAAIAEFALEAMNIRDATT